MITMNFLSTTRDFTLYCVGRGRKGNRRRGGVHWRETGLVAFAGALHTGVTMIMITIITVDLAQHFVRQVDLRP